MEKEFLDSLPESLLNELLENQKYKIFDDSYLVSRQGEMERKKKELHKLKSDLEILKEQEGDNNCEEEEKKVEYWLGWLDNHKSNLSAIQAAEDQLNAMKAKYERKKIFYEGRVSGAKAELERKQNKKSKPQIKLNYKIDELEKDIQGFNEQYTGCMKYKDAKEKYDKLYSAWKQKRLKKLAQTLSPEPTPAPKNTLVVPKTEEVKPQHPPVIQNTKKTPKLPAKQPKEVPKVIQEDQSVSSD